VAGLVPTGQVRRSLSHLISWTYGREESGAGFPTGKLPIRGQS
jgi:hypothetical protein